MLQFRMLIRIIVIIILLLVLFSCSKTRAVHEITFLKDRNYYTVHTPLMFKFYTGVLGSFLLVGDAGESEPSEISI